MSISLIERAKNELTALESANLAIHPKVLQSKQRSIVKIDGKEVVNLASNNYLGFCDHPFLKERAKEYLENWGVGAGAVRTIAGTLTIHEDFEKQLAKFKGTESALVIHSGFSTNQGVLGGILLENDMVFSDELNHASIIDGLRLCKAKRFVWRHKDLSHLEELLQTNDTNGMKLIVTDGVFSMDGDIAPLKEIVLIARRYKAIVYVDDAHGSGVLGHNGRGTVHHFGFDFAPDIIQVGTLSKAWAGVGGYVAGPAVLRELLINRARPYLFSTAQPPSVVGALSAAIELIQKEPSIMEKLWENTRYFKNELKNLGFDTMGSETPITPVLFGETKTAFMASKMLLDRGIFAVGIGFPTVSQGKARIRNIVTAEHTSEDLNKALEAYKNVGKDLLII